MSFDCSRFSFNAWHDFLGVIMQQGRVQLDADWNEFVVELLRRIQAGSLDTFGGPVVPRVTPKGFQIEANAGKLTIGVGRMYVDGLLAENHGKLPLTWDTALAEQAGTLPLDYTEQPYFPDPPALPGGGPHLVYLDVWQREVTYLQARDLVEKAVGVDTTGRLQTVWQVRVLPAVSPADCGAAIASWDTRASGARLTTGTGPVASSPDPCLIPPSGGYQGLENQLYRVQIHDAGAGATFKWSRDNGTVASRATHINTNRDRIVVERTGVDDLLRFNDGDWVEVIDDVLELQGKPGIVRRIAIGGGVDDATHTLVLTTQLPLGTFPTNAQNETDASRNTRVRRWDQRGRVLRADGTLFLDLDTSVTGVIPVPPVGTKLFLENGILVNFDLDPTGNGYHVGDYWSFAARAADASIEILQQAPPRGIHHHFARLGFVTFPNDETDCRVLWPPEDAGGHDCTCDRCVSPEAHNAGTGTLQQAVDALPKGGVICLDVGIYHLKETLRINKANSLKIRGKGAQTMLVMEGPGSAIQIADATGLTIESLSVTGAASPQAPSALITARDAAGLALRQLFLTAISPAVSQSSAISLGGYAIDVRISECAIVADRGITGGDDEKDLLLSRGIAISDNLFTCPRRGVSVGQFAMHHGEWRVRHNLFTASTEVGFLFDGAAVPPATLLIENNVLVAPGDAIRAGIDGLRILNNEILGDPESAPGSGIVLETGKDPSGIGHCWIIGNRVAAMAGDGISIRTPLGSAMIKQNVIERTGGGIVFSEGGSAQHLSIENNQLLSIAAGANPDGSVAAIQVLSTVHVAIGDNVISGLAPDAVQARDRVAIRTVDCSDVQIHGNHLSGLGPSREHAGYAAGIEVVAPVRMASISDNIIQRIADGDMEPAEWYAIREGTPTRTKPFKKAITLMGAKDTIYLLTAKSLKALDIAATSKVSARTNQVLAQLIVNPIVLIEGPNSVQFADNDCEASAGQGMRDVAIVQIDGITVITCQNRVHWTQNDADAIRIVSKLVTVLGNITMGRILVNNVPLSAPWNVLNVIG